MKFELGDTNAKLLEWIHPTQDDGCTIIDVAILNVPIEYLSLYNFCITLYLTDEDFDGILTNKLTTEQWFNEIIEGNYIRLYSNGKMGRQQFSVLLTEDEKEVIIKLISENFEGWYIDNYLLV